MIEIIISLSMIGAIFFKKDYFKITKAEVKTLLISLIPILLVAGYFGYKTLSDPGEVTVSDIEFSEEYKLENDTYIFDEGKEVNRIE